jgi:hypothetical protein
MKVRQRVYLSVHSSDLTPERIDAELGLSADESRLLGSKKVGPPPVPRYHIWNLFSGAPDASSLRDHFSVLFERMMPASDAIAKLAGSGKADVIVQVVRYFDPGPEDEAILAARDAGLPPDIEILRGQHPLLGFYFDREQLAWLGRLGVGVDFDEYGDEHE